MSDDFYREVILDHYKNPRRHGTLAPCDARAEGQNSLCGDEVTVMVNFNGSSTIKDVRFQGRGCAISQAATSMLMEMIEGKTADEVAAMPTQDLLDEIGIPLTPIRLKCALLGLGVLKVALHRSQGTPFPKSGLPSKSSRSPRQCVRSTSARPRNSPRASALRAAE
jgi:nitrogen fixation NifU-like protein